MSEIICRKCGKPAKANDQFCAACGVSINSAQAMGKERGLRQFKSARELAEYLSNVDERLERLETENRKLKKKIKIETREVNNDLDHIYEIFSVTNLFSKNFLKRAFAVWGHFFVANLLISIVAVVVYFLLVATLLTSILG